MNVMMEVANQWNAVRPRKAVLEMPEYHPPLAGREVLRLDFNENTFEPSPRVMRRLRAITAEGLTKYPEREPVERIVAAHFRLQAEQVLLTNGVDEAIHLICATFLEAEDEALVWTPSFFMYDVGVQMMTPHLRKVQSDATLAFPVERFMAGITERTKLILVASPNNPTGAVVSREHLLTIAKTAPHAVLMVDEAYYHFHGESMIGDVATVPNLIVARTFSKAYGMASLRIGMLAGNATLLKYVRKVSSPYNVNGVALDCLPVAIADQDYLAWYTGQVRVGRERMMEGLRELGVPFFPSCANFVLMNIGPKHKELVAAMRTHGVLLRDRSSDPGCDGFVRITIGVEEHVKQGLAALQLSLKETGWEKQQACKPAEQQASSDVREFE
jgi:histidinol-phosphate aminotransferase